MRKLINWITCKVRGHRWVNTGGIGVRQKDCQRCHRTEFYAFDYDTGRWLSLD